MKTSTQLFYFIFINLCIPLTYSDTFIQEPMLSPVEVCNKEGVLDSSGNLVSVISDVSLINATHITCIVQPKSIDSVVSFVAWSYRWNQSNIDRKIEISIAGTKHSQGGHISSDSGITLDLSRLNKVYEPVLNNDSWQVKVESGALWNQVHDVIKNNPNLPLANKVQQSSTPFSVGGSVSVNAHGRSFNYGSVINSVKSIQLVLPRGEIITASRVENSELFYAAIGGYGLFGVIVEVVLELVPNHKLTVESRRFQAASQYIEYILDAIEGVDRGAIERAIDGSIEKESYSPISYLFATVSLDSENFLNGVTSYIYKQKDTIDYTGYVNPDPKPKVFNKAWFTKIGFWLKQRGYLIKTSQYFQHKFLLQQDTRLKTLTPPINPILAATDPEKPDLLQEYFVPVNNIPAFLNTVKDVFMESNVVLSNVSLRFIPKSKETSLLSYESSDVDQFAVVLYFSLENSEQNLIDASGWTRKLVQRALDLDGRHYLPYQKWPSKEQVKRAYPAYHELNRLKAKYDSDQTFTNSFYKHYF